MSGTSGKQNQPFDERLAEHALTPLWDRYMKLMSLEPKVKSLPHIWQYPIVKEFLLEAAEVVSPEDAERRVLLFENPALPGTNQVTESLLSGIQMIMPKEFAPLHRHVPSDARLILEGAEGAYTTVNGKQLQMDFGDFIITPGWTWHDHGHNGSKPVVWQDILDIPLAKSIGPIFFENDMKAPELLENHDEALKLRYPYKEAQDTIEELADSENIDPHFGYKKEYTNPSTGASAMETISACLQYLPRAYRTRLYQSTESMIFTCVEGSGKITAGHDDAYSFDFSGQDIFVVPCWYPFEIESKDDCFLFVSSDKAAQVKLGYWRDKKH